MLSVARGLLRQRGAFIATRIILQRETSTHIADYVIVDHTYDAVVVGAGSLIQSFLFISIPKLRCRRGKENGA
ncbi:unnamed protein product [Gongylonema pulchrum]|uniref:Uncharacterized protein n=1 Tax=Gongylonema pulchrum TaxID=637853 RepID=A0A183D515_9BILA|nr:unnamed protein product [Gongylonema pulchrum]